MKTMPTAFLLTGLDVVDLLMAASEWEWDLRKSVGDDLIFVTPDGEVVRTLNSATRASRLRRGVKIYLGPSHQETLGISGLILKISIGAFDVHHWPPRNRKAR